MLLEGCDGFATGVEGRGAKNLKTLRAAKLA